MKVPRAAGDKAASSLCSGEVVISTRSASVDGCDAMGTPKCKMS
jgi:hypothetical protein